ncbi:hypothetical protein NL108_015609 [Boleophthalmus pectinirostris]|nr:hypothetical protein NL108_015609 [Boleophthalmus pectinirostris]
MKECKCHLFADSMNCSWIPNPKRAPLSLSYRECGSTLKLIKMNFTKCQRTNHIGPKRVCHLTGNFLQKDLCMVAESPDALSTFRAPKAVKLPEKMEISEEGSNLVLKLMPLDVVIPSSVYYISYSICDKNLDMEYPIGDQSKTIPYDKSCQYKFRYQARFTRYSLQFYSDWSEEFVYGSTDRTLTVVAVVIPIIVSVCVILSCVCFRR